MLIQRSIMQHSLDRSDGQSASGCLIYPVGSFSGHIYRRKGCIIAERKPVGIGRLPMLKPRVLFCVPVKKLYLEPGVVDEKDIRCRHLGICAEKDFPNGLFTTPEFCNHDLDLAFEGLAFDRGAVKRHLFSIDVGGIPDEHVISQIVDIDGSVKFSGATPSFLARTSIEILQHRIITQPAYHAESKPGCPRDEIIAREQAVPDKNVGYLEELSPMVENRPEALRRLAVALVLHVLKIEWRAASGGERNRLYCEKESRIADSCGNLGEAKNLKTTFDRTGASRPVSAKTWSLLAGFAYEAVVKSNSDPMSAFFKEHACIKGAPVELLLEVLPEAAIAGLSLTGHRQEIHSSVYRQYQNYCLDEEAFEIFSYLCSAIECGCNNRTYLVKWLDYIHNLLIWNYKVTKNLALDQILTTLILLKINKINIYLRHGCYDSKFNELLSITTIF